jgi:hypothetical protein
MLAAALEAEVAAYIATHAGELDTDGRRLVVRNGHAVPRQVLTSAGAVEVVTPRVNDKRVDETGERRRFASAIPPAWCRKSPQISEVLPLLYLHGLSSSDFLPALQQFLGTGSGLSAATITRLTVQWQDEARAFAGRDLPGVDYVYLWADGVHLNVRLDKAKLCLLVMVGVRVDGRKELIALAEGYRESTESWADLLRDCKRRGMRAPVLAVADGALPGSGTRYARFPGNAGAALLVPQDRQCSRGSAEVSASWSEAPWPRSGTLRTASTPAARWPLSSWPTGRSSARRPRRHRRAPGLLRLPGRALGAPAHHEPDRVDLRHRPAPDQGHQGPWLEGRRPGHGLQADRGRPTPVACGQRTAPGRPGACRRSLRTRLTRQTNHSEARHQHSRLINMVRVREPFSA